MDAGRLDRIVDIQQRTTTQDAIGQPVESWSLVASVWANIRYQSGIEAIKSDADHSIVKANLRIRYRTGITHGMRVQSGDDLFQINAVLPWGRNQYLDLVCESIT